MSLDEAIARAKNPVPKAKALSLVIDGIETLVYNHLCEECRGIVATYANGMKTQEKKSARRFKRVPTEVKAPLPSSRSPSRLRVERD